MIMNATVIQSDPGSLLVRDQKTQTEYIVFYPRAQSFSSGDQVIILYNGRATMSIPPQITASYIERIRIPTRPPRPENETLTATVLSVHEGYLMVFNDANGQQVHVNFEYAHHFCPGQQVTVRYNGVMTRSIPPQITAEDITPFCM